MWKWIVGIAFFGLGLLGADRWAKYSAERGKGVCTLGDSGVAVSVPIGLFETLKKLAESAGGAAQNETLKKLAGKMNLGVWLLVAAGVGLAGFARWRRDIYSRRSFI